jgi:molybdopterin-containing oxidoreductase family iron-sulfur binding subunit
MTQLVWENAALVAPALAERMHVRNGDVVQVSAGERFVLAPVWVVPGQAEHVVTLPLGYGRVHAGRVGSGLGFDAYRLRTTDALWHLPGARVSATGARATLASTQMHHSMEGRPLVRSATLEEYRREPAFARGARYEGAAHEGPASLYPEHEYDGYAWGMTIDLNACMGCNACTIACQAENNIPIVGKEQVLVGREMHWIRVDRYFEGDLDEPAAHFQPVPCMHCENAPCEVVCPVNATVHSDEGLNDMVYNRCVGTRYCQNNCPYKVRRFNFLLYQDWSDGPQRLRRNPDVSVRSRGVMEKCTYCVQRISAARIEAKKEGRRIRDGEVQTACEQVCPSEAIRFGDLNDASARVRALKDDPRNYALLGELGTRPRTTYLASVRNPNPEIEKLAVSGAAAQPETSPPDAPHASGEPLKGTEGAG